MVWVQSRREKEKRKSQVWVNISINDGALSDAGAVSDGGVPDGSLIAPEGKCSQAWTEIHENYLECIQNG